MLLELTYQSGKTKQTCSGTFNIKVNYQQEDNPLLLYYNVFSPSLFYRDIWTMDSWTPLLRTRHFEKNLSKSNFCTLMFLRHRVIKKEIVCETHTYLQSLKNIFSILFCDFLEDFNFTSLLNTHIYNPPNHLLVEPW